MGLSIACRIFTHCSASGVLGCFIGASTPILRSHALGNPVKTCQHILTISLLRRGAQIGFEASFPNPLFARLGKSCQNVPAHFDDFPFKAWRASLATGGYCPYAGRAVPPGTRNGQPLPHFVRARLRDSSIIRLPPKSLNRFFRRRRASVLQEGTALGPRGPHVPWTGNAGAFQLAASTPILCPRAGGNLIQTRTTRLNDFLIQQSRAVEL